MSPSGPFVDEHEEFGGYVTFGSLCACSSLFYRPAEKIKVIERNRIVFGKEYIPISDNYKQHFLEMIERRSDHYPEITAG